MKRAVKGIVMKLIDIGANLTDPMFRGIYGGSKKHQQDLNLVIERAWKNDLDKIIITVGTLTEADEALEIAASNEKLFTTMGCHPTRCDEFKENPEKYFQNLSMKITSNPNKVVAIGECGLDYERLNFCEKDTQKKYFEEQIKLSKIHKLPLFLHCRNSHDDFIDILLRTKDIWKNFGGVVHSFDGSYEDALKLLNLGLYIGLNGCSLKTETSLKVVEKIPLNRILIETDSPWCGIRPSHVSSKYVKTKFSTVKKKQMWTKDVLIDGRNEPCQLRQVLEVIADIRCEPIEKLSEIVYENTMELFFTPKVVQ